MASGSPAQEELGQNSVLVKEIENMRVDIRTLRNKIDQVLQRQEDLFKMYSKNNNVVSQKFRLPDRSKSRFPLKTEEDLKQLDEDLATEKREEIIAEMKAYIFGSIKNIENCIDQHIITTFNYDGKKGKKCLKLYGNFVDALHEATTDGSKPYEYFVEDLKMVFRTIKNRCNKFRSRLKMKGKSDADESEDADDPLSTYSKCRKRPQETSTEIVKRLKSDTNTNEHPQTRTDKRRRCLHCSEVGVDNRTSVLCTICKIHLCRTADRDCFTEYHKYLKNST